MSNPAKRPRQNRNITVDFNDEQTYHRLCQDGPGFIDFVVAFILSIGFQLAHKCDCPSGKLTRHSHYVRARLNGLTIWRIQCTACRAVFTVLPHFVLRYRKMKAEVAKKVRFLSNTLGSIAELETQLLLAGDLGYTTQRKRHPLKVNLTRLVE